MNLTVENLNQKNQTNNVSKKELLAKLHELPKKIRRKATDALTTVCSRVRAQCADKYKKRQEGKLKTPSNESFLDSGRGKKPRPKPRGPFQRRNQDRDRNREPPRGKRTTNPARPREPMPRSEREMLLSTLVAALLK